MIAIPGCEAPPPGTASREPYLAARVLNALLREDYGGVASLLTRDKDGVALVLASGRRVRLSPGGLFQDFVLAATESLSLEEVLRTLETVADPADAPGVAAFATECHEALTALELYDRHRESSLIRLLRQEQGLPVEHPQEHTTNAVPPADPSGPPLTDPSGPPATDPDHAALTGPSRPSVTGPGHTALTDPTGTPVTGPPTGPGGRHLAGSGGAVVGQPRAAGWSPIFYETLAAAVDHPIYPTARCRLGVSSRDMLAYAPEFAPGFDLRWAAVRRDRVTVSGRREESWWPKPGDVGLPDRLAGTHTLFPVHPLTVPAVTGIPGVVVGPVPYLRVRPTLSMRTVEVDRRTHLKLPLATSTLGLRNRRSIKPASLRDGALAESLLREVLHREPDLRVSLAGEQRYGHAGHEYLGWMVRDLPEGEIVSVASLLAPFPGQDHQLLDSGRSVLEHLAHRYFGPSRDTSPGSSHGSSHGGSQGATPRDRSQSGSQSGSQDGSQDGEVRELLRDYLTTLFTWNVRLFVRYGIALEAHQQNLSLVFGDGPPRLLVKDNDGLLASPDRLRAAGLGVPHFADERMLTDDPHALADVFVTITLHLAATAVAFGAVGQPHGAGDRQGRGGGGLVRETLGAALDEFGEHPMARLLRARTLDAARLVGKSMVTAATLVDKRRSGAGDVNKFYGTSGPNYLRHPTSRDLE